MGLRLSLLLLCDRYEPYSLFISELVSADFQVLIARSSQRAQRLLSSLTVDAIMILPRDHRAEEAMASSLKRQAPGTPIFLLSQQNHGRQPGIESFWQADVREEVLARAVAFLFRQSLLARIPRREGKANAAVAGAGPPPAA